MKQIEYAGIGREHRVATIHHNGTRVTLDDGSVWDIPVGPSAMVAGWYPSQHIIVRASEDGSERYVLINVDTSGPDTVTAHLTREK